jgi:hypothetical protein
LSESKSVTATQCWGWECVALYLYSPHTPLQVVFYFVKRLCPYPVHIPAVYFRGVQYQNGAFDCGIVISDVCNVWDIISDFILANLYPRPFSVDVINTSYLKICANLSVITDSRDETLASRSVATAP